MEFRSVKLAGAAALLGAVLMVGGCGGEEANAENYAKKNQDADPAPLESTMMERNARIRFGEASDDPQLTSRGLPKQNGRYVFEPVPPADREQYELIEDRADGFWIFHQYRKWPLHASVILSTMPQPSEKNGVSDMLQPYGMYFEDYTAYYRKPARENVYLDDDKEMELAKAFNKLLADSPKEYGRLYRLRFSDMTLPYRGFDSVSNEFVFDKDLFTHQEKPAELYRVNSDSVPFGFVGAKRDSTRIPVEDEAVRKKLEELAWKKGVGFDVYGSLQALYQETSSAWGPTSNVAVYVKPHFVDVYVKDTKEVLFSFEL